MDQSMEGVIQGWPLAILDIRGGYSINIIDVV